MNNGSAFVAVLVASSDDDPLIFQVYFLLNADQDTF